VPPAVELAPFAIPRDSFFTATLHVPPLEAAMPLDDGVVSSRLQLSCARSIDEAVVHGVRSRFDADLWEWAAPEIACGCGRNFEFGVRAAVRGWDEQKDVFEVRDDSGSLIVRDEQAMASFGTATQRHENVSDLLLRASWRCCVGTTACRRWR